MSDEKKEEKEEENKENLEIINPEETEYITSTISISIPEYENKYIGNKNVTFYRIKVIDYFKKTSWTLDKRYSEFESLYKSLQEIFSQVPQTPGKTLFKVSSVEAIKKRQKDLEKFLKECINRKDIFSTKELKNFLDLETHCPHLTNINPSEEGKLENIPLGVRDFIYDNKEGVIFMCCSDMNIISRADSMLSNFRFPWEKKSEENVPLGGAFCFRVQKLEIGFEFVRCWSKAYTVQTGIINYDKKTLTVAVGLDDGSIFLYKVEPESNFSKFSDLKNIKPHNDRVMGIEFDSDLGKVYSVSTDKLFLVSDINYEKSEPIIVNKGQYGYTNIFYDKENQRCFLTNEGGQIEVYLTNNFPPNLVTSFKTSSGGCIRGLNINLKKQLMFTTDMIGKITVIDLNIPGKEKNISEISTFGAKSKLRIAVFDGNNSEIITGDEDGRITIWSLKNGESIFVWVAHPKSAITQMVYQEDERLLWSGAKDRSIKIWKLPEKWVSEEIENFEMNELKKINDQIAEMKIKKKMEMIDDDEDEYASSGSLEDDLNGWNYRKD
jgi:WD40 repeat protein